MDGQDGQDAYVLGFLTTEHTEGTEKLKGLLFWRWASTE